MADEEGRSLTLAHGQDAWACLAMGRAGGEGQGTEAHSSPVLLLGLGPEAGVDVPAALGEARTVLWVECPAFVQSMEDQCPGWCKRIPAHWQRVHADDVPALARGCSVLFYQQNLRLFPSFWGALLGGVQAALLRGGAAQQARQSVLLPGGAGDLLHRELTEALGAAGFIVRPLPTGADFSQALRALLREEQPVLCLAVNGRGLDAQGVDFALLRACGVPVALWMVDNIWHILSGWQQGWWRDAHVFVTDHSFIPGLHAVGAGRVWHLPLAAAQHMASETELASRAILTSRAADYLSFVGRASFPGRDKFFAAAQVPSALWDEAEELLGTAASPHFHWWAERLNLTLWPGHAVRQAGLGAERCSALRRAQWLRVALPHGLSVYGGAGEWQELLPEAPAASFRPAVDYYGALAEVYARSMYSLNVTSLLLPAGLTQRHFDVWAAGGFLLSDATSGLDIFPASLVTEMRVARPQDLPAALQRLDAQPALRRDVAEAWRAHVREQHSYDQRVATVLTALGL